MSKEKKGKETENQIEEKRSQIKISVRNLVEFIFREGDIDNRHGQSVSPEAMLAGSRMHRRIQKRMGSDYHAEVPLKLVIGEENYDLVLEGRADGIQITSESEREIDYSSNFNSMTIEEDMNVVIDEIKEFAAIKASIVNIEHLLEMRRDDRTDDDLMKQQYTMMQKQNDRIDQLCRAIENMASVGSPFTYEEPLKLVKKNKLKTVAWGILGIMLFLASVLFIIGSILFITYGLKA